MNKFSLKLQTFLFLALFTPVAVFPTLKESMDKIEDLVTQKKYVSACREVRYLCSDNLNEVDNKQALQFAIEKAKFFASLEVDENEKEFEIRAIDFELENLSRQIISDLFKTSPAEAGAFAGQMLELVHKKWPYVVGLIIEELFYQVEHPLLSGFEQIIDNHLTLSSQDSVSIFSDKLDARFMTIHNILGSFHTPDNTPIVASNHDLDLNIVDFGKKYVDNFFINEQELIKNFVDKNYEIIKEHIEQYMEQSIDDDSADSKEDEAEKEAWKSEYSSILATKQSTIKSILDGCAGNTASLALSTALIIKKDDAIKYLKDIYNKLIQHGYPLIAEGLKMCVINPPKDIDSDEAFSEIHFIENPKHVEATELVKIPEYLKLAFSL